MKPGKAGRVRVGLAAAGVDLQLLLAESRFRVAGKVVERPVDRNAVILVADLIVVAAANVDGLIDADLIGRNVRSRHRRDRGVRVVQAAAAAQRRGRARQARADRIDVGTGPGPHRTERRTRRNASDLLEAFRQRDRDGLALIGKDRDARDRNAIVTAVLRGDRVRVRSEGKKCKAPGRVGRNVRDLRRAGGRNGCARDRSPRRRIDDGSRDGPGGRGRSRLRARNTITR